MVNPEEVYDYIIATKSHAVDGDADVNKQLFMDIDMAILGTPWESTTLACLRAKA